MGLGKPISGFALLTLTILLLLSLAISEPIEKESFVDEDMEGIEELLALDEEVEQQQETHARFSEAEVLTRAQRIVVELNSDSSKRVIEQNEYVLVLGYAPWCARSAELMPQFAEAANTLKALGSSVVLAKLDSERYPKAASALKIKGFPTLLLFVNGTSQAYTGGYSAEEIVIWARKKTGVPVVRVNCVTEAEEFLKKYHMFAVGVFEKFEGSAYEEFVKTATADNEIQFVEVSNLEAARVLYPDVESYSFFLGIVKSEPERYAGYEGAFEMEKLLQFLDHNKFPLVTKLTELNSVRVYSSPIKLQLFVFANAQDFKDLHEPLQDVARKFKSKIMFIYIDIADENLAKPFLTLYGLEDTEDTVVAAFDSKISSKYLLETDPTPANIEDFSSKFLQGSLSPYFKSQPVPDSKEASIQVVVGKTFDDIVLNSPKTVFLEVHSPWCINCETTSKQVEKLAKHFKDLNNLVFARIDASANEHPKLQVVDYPTLLLYPASDKANPIKVLAKSSLKSMANFISKHLRSSDDDPKDEL
ncbi:protein disulfide isomerase-like 1-6 isoform X3 [Rhodamnia argentea]|uniref:Protein disulfide isomerase-like 1-6 isoform X3 n=1 Tax=Rhodamnia argentea TaxID=178133 RepID=A0A8B8NSM8_9MYRT|nr:protein disulfide isomerase-like 1-6 isoform X3 [Rhodamnia argentea]